MTTAHAAADKSRAAIDASRVAWEAKLLPAVSSRVADAHAHAVKALTETLKATADGRSSLLQINRSPSYAAAGNRLDELWTWLTGPSETSLKGQIRDAREAFYRESCVLAFPLIPEVLRSRDVAEPNAMQVRLIRAAPIHGTDPRKELAGAIDAAKRSLKAALEQAARRSTPDHVAADTLAGWESKTANTLRTAVRLLLSDSAYHAFREAGRNLIAPEHLAE